MSRTTSAPTATAAAKPITQPGILVQIGFASVLRYSSRADVAWGGFTWQANNVRASALQELPNGSAGITVVIGNTDRAFGALCMNEAPQEKAIAVWQFYEGATATADPVPLFAGVIDTCDISEAAVTLGCSDLNNSTLFVPRMRISRATGFNHLMPAGRVLEWNGQRFEFSRAAN